MPRAAGALILCLVLAISLALLSVYVQRQGPEQVVYSNLCGPTASDLCYRPVLKGGFPFAYLFDAPGVSVENQLAFVEDDFHPIPFFLDAALYFILFIIGMLGVRRLISGARLSR